MSNKANTEVSHWKRNAAIGLIIILPIMAFSFGYYAMQQGCKAQYDRLMDPSIIGLILDPVNYMNEYESFRNQCAYFYNFEDPEIVQTVDQIMSSFKQYRVSDFQNDLDDFITGLQPNQNPEPPEDFIDALSRGQEDEYVRDLQR